MTRRRVAVAVGAIVAVGGAAGVILATSLTGSTQAASQAAKASGSSTVQRRDLVETDTESGTLSYADPQTVFNRISGTVTSLPAVGQVIKAGGTLYRVDGAPVVLFNGIVPAYRDLSAGDTAGSDVKELKQNLKALGFDPDHEITVNDTFDAATTAAVERWQQSVGETQTGTISLGQVVFLPGSQRITTVDAVLGSNGGSGAGGSGTAASTSTTPASHAEFVDLTTSSAGGSDGSWSKQGSSADRKPPTCPAGEGTGKPSANQASDKPPTCKPGSASGSGSGNGAGKTTQGQPTGQTLAALLALLKAQTLELQHSHTAGGSSSAPTSAGRAGGTTTAHAGSGRGGGGGFAQGGSASAATAESGSRSGGSVGSGGGSATGSDAASAAGAPSAAGAASASAEPILQTTSTKLVVTVDLDATMQSEAVVHEPVTVEMPDGSTVDGRITEVSPVAQSTSSSSSSSSSAGASTSSGAGASGGGSSSPSATVPVTITLTGHRHAAGLDQAAVSVNFEQQKASNVLSVPVTALLATAGGGYAVQEAAPTHRLIAVTPGLFAAGYVQISGSGVYPGLQVTDSQG